MIFSEQFYQSEKKGYLNEEFRLFHIKDQTGQEFSYHYHDFHKVVIFLSGKVTYHIEGKAYHLKPWDILLVSRHAIHKSEIDASVPYERFILWIKNDIPNKQLLQCFQKASDRSYNLVRLNSSLQEKLKDVLFELEASARSEAFGKDILTQALFQEFMVYLNRIFLEKQYIFDKKSYSYDSQIANILKYINHHLGEDLSVDALASRHYISKYHLMRKFKEETGYTLHNYVINKRLLQARTLISEGTPILKAAHESGFAEYSTFSRAYRKQFGKAPSEEQ
ncbi:AraC family transcriptional regulator [Blautia luti]|uniref:Helix-turn-helix domain-containing protein n=1 Tax=Blautia luti DSM 14534 = JCM 17040 TaxID=649762 RepID=A0A844GH96_9FIRM|nr:AraC family transcriptional regulator [Blautia luti]MTD60008.1 helix-turn-helix domain-containing protein [Blautia luti DSM 14534 = JCM 17040]BEI61853.1 AraC family transcriptional regulator [Blautia luti]